MKYLINRCEICGKTEGKIYGKSCKFNKSLCNTCYSKMQKEIGSGKSCEICGCTKGYIHGKKGKHGMDLCARHRSQIRSSGNTFKSLRDSNEIIEYNDYAEIIMVNRDMTESGRAVIDTDDLPKVKGLKWRMHKGYAKSGRNSVILHRIIMDCPKDMVVDHCNHNTLDNRKANLRICTKQQNTFNIAVRKNNTSGVTGVSYHRGKWRARIKVGYNEIFLGNYSVKQEAIDVRLAAENKYFGEFAYKDCGARLDNAKP